MAAELHAQTKTRPLDTHRAELLYQIAEQLRYIRAILEMLEAGGWTNGAGAHLEMRLGVARLTAGQLCWPELEGVLGDLQREIAICVRHNCAPNPGTTISHHAALAEVLAPRPALRREAPSFSSPPVA